MSSIHKLLRTLGKKVAEPLIVSITLFSFCVFHFSWRSTPPTWNFNLSLPHSFQLVVRRLYNHHLYPYVRPAWAYALLYRAAQSERRGGSELCGSVEHVGYVYCVFQCTLTEVC
ncbi:hypothetical protein AMECASPLE_004735 [Ameca splendens]|uniref:Uncharacterized protein n=1 Tax=Ameca splendens TaxID=208324 RepID=A0ABV1A7D3_9TELE